MLKLRLDALMVLSLPVELCRALQALVRACALQTCAWCRGAEGAEASPSAPPLPVLPHQRRPGSTL